MMPNAFGRRELPRRRNSGSPTSENSENANFLELRNAEVQHSPTPIGQGRQRGAAYIVGYYAPGQRENPEVLLGVWGGAKQRPRQSRRPSAAKSIIRAEVPKDTGPIYLQASFFRAAAARHYFQTLDFLAHGIVEDGVGQKDQPVRAGVGVGVLAGFAWTKY